MSDCLIRLYSGCSYVDMAMWKLLIPFVPNASFLYPLKTSENRKDLKSWIWSYSMKKSLIENFIFCAVTVFPVDMFHSFTLPGNLWCWSVLYSNTLLKRFLDILKELTKMDIFKSVSLWLKRLCELVTHILPFIVKWKQTGFEGKFD